MFYIREILDVSDRKKELILSKLNKANGVVFIDYSTFRHLEELKIKSIVLNNPFDMRQIKSIDRSKVLEKLKLSSNDIIISILGTVNKGKGIDFIIDSFNEVQNKNLKLLIVGNSNNFYGNECKKISSSNDNILFIDELNDVSSIYAISDYVIRGEPIFAIGRTTYEGLYSKCEVIIPGNEKNYSEIFEYEKFRQNIWFYETRNKRSLISVLNNCEKVVKKFDDDMTNIKSYLIKHTEFISEVNKANKRGSLNE